MKKHFKSRKSRVGLSPGTVKIGDSKSTPAHIEVFHYSPDFIIEKELKDIDDIKNILLEEGIVWINIVGTNDAEAIMKLGKIFDLHPLLLEDVVSLGQRPKCDDYGEKLYLLVKMLSYSDSNGVDSEQLSLVLVNNVVISIQERPGDVFDNLRQRIRAGRGRIRNSGSDYLLNAIVDSIVDNIFLVLEQISNRMEKMEAEILEEALPETLLKLNAIKHDLIFLRRSLWPLREALGDLDKTDTKLITQETRFFFRGVYDHIIQAVDAIETFRDISFGLSDTYMSIVSNRMNEIMKVLTIISTIFIPLTFIAGIYGMNFENMPELGHKYSYFAVLILMVIIAFSMMWFFRRKKWL